MVPSNELQNVVLPETRPVKRHTTQFTSTDFPYGSIIPTNDVPRVNQIRVVTGRDGAGVRELVPLFTMAAELRGREARAPRVFRIVVPCVRVAVKTQGDGVLEGIVTTSAARNDVVDLNFHADITSADGAVPRAGHQNGISDLLRESHLGLGEHQQGGILTGNAVWTGGERR